MNERHDAREHQCDRPQRVCFASAARWEWGEIKMRRERRREKDGKREINIICSSFFFLFYLLILLMLLKNYWMSETDQNTTYQFYGVKYFSMKTIFLQ